MNSKINSLKNTNNQLNSKIIGLQSDLYSKTKEIKDLNNKLNSSSNSNDNLENISPGEKIMAIHFISTDQKINYALPCKNTDIFVKLEEKIYEEYPEYKEENTYFTVRGNMVKRFKSMQDNGIKNSDIIILNIYE